jgi:ribosomal protein S18 acetylase RimI-like enzyme
MDSGDTALEARTEVPATNPSPATSDAKWSDLEFEDYKVDLAEFSSFDCGENSLNDFLKCGEATHLEEEMLGRTTLVRMGGKLVAYYTLYSSMVRTENLSPSNCFGQLRACRIEGIPCVSIGRLAVGADSQSRGIGKEIVKRIAADATHNSMRAAVRLMVVQARAGALGFYEGLGFTTAAETRREMRRLNVQGTRTMFFDLAAIRDSG